MSARWFRKIQVMLGSADGVTIDANTQEKTRSELSTGDTPFFTKQTNSTMVVPNGGASTPMPLGPVTNGKALSFTYDKAISVSINGGTAIQLSIPSTGEGVFHLEGAFTTVAFVNNGATNANVSYLVVGT